MAGALLLTGYNSANFLNNFYKILFSFNKTLINEGVAILKVASRYEYFKMTIFSFNEIYYI